MAIRTYLSIITLIVSGLDAPIKRYKVADWIKRKQNPSICYLQENHFRTEDTHGLKVRGWKKYFLQMETRKQG